MHLEFNPEKTLYEQNTEFLEKFSETYQELQDSFTTKEQALMDKLYKLQEELSEVRRKKSDALIAMRDKKWEAAKQVEAYKVAKLKEDEENKLSETVDLIKEICEGYAAWEAARPYQIEDVVQIVHMYLTGMSGIMNANEMALGKTFETLVALKIICELHKREHGNLPRMLWLTKLSILLTGGTVKEAKRWFPELMIFAAKGSEPPAAKEMYFEVAASGGLCIITNYEAVKTTPAIQKIQWDILVMDEVHKLKGGANAKPSQIWTAVKDLDCKFKIMLTGTPLVNRLEEVWSYLHIFDADLFPSSRQFTRQFAALRDLSGKLKFDMGSEKLLKDILRRRLIRRTAHEVGLQIPEEVYQDIFLEHNDEQGKIYRQMQERFFIWLEGQDETHLTANSILTQLIRLRQINVLPVANFKIRDEEGNVVGIEKLEVRDSSKLDEAVNIITQTNDQCIVGCNFNEPLEELALRLQVEGLRPEIISSKYAQQMDKFEVGFQNGEIDVLLINLAMGEGLNLHKDSDKWSGGARAVIFLDKWYNNARNDQFKKRAIRPGKNTGEPVFVYNLQVENSVDAYIEELCAIKAEQFGNLTEDSGLRPTEGFKAHLKRLFG